MSGQWNDIVCKTIIVTLTTCWLWRVMSTVNGRHEINNQKHCCLHVDLKILILKRERGADGVWTIENKTRSSRCLNVQRESWVVVTPPPPPRVQVMVPRCSSLSSHWPSAGPRQDVWWVTWSHSFYPLILKHHNFQFLCVRFETYKTEMTPTHYIIFWVVCSIINILLPGRLLIMLRQRQVLAGEAVDQRQSVILLDHSEPCNGFQWEVLEEVTRGGGCQSQGQEPGTSWYQLEQWACADSDDDQQPVTKGHDIELNSIGTCGLIRTKMNCVL